MTPDGTTLHGHLETHDGSRLLVRTWPVESPGAVAVIVHGLGDHSGRYDHVARALNGIGVEAYAYDQRGHGESSGPRGHAPSFGHLLADLDRAWVASAPSVPGVPRFVVGHSLGGLVGLAWTQTRRPALAGLVLSAPWIATATPTPRWMRWGARLLGRVAPRLTFDAGIDSTSLSTDPAMIARHESDPLVHSRISPRLFVGVEDWQRRVTRLAGALKVPTLLLVPGADTLVDARATRRLARSLDSRLVDVMELPDMRHEVFHERARHQVLAQVVEWIAVRMR